jgi:hypothetical protein
VKTMDRITMMKIINNHDFLDATSVLYGLLATVLGATGSSADVGVLK